jgi:hypothetical protein
MFSKLRNVSCDFVFSNKKTHLTTESTPFPKLFVFRGLVQKLINLNAWVNLSFVEVE